MEDQPLITTPPKKQSQQKPPEPKPAPEPTGYMVKKDTSIGGVIGLIHVEAYKPIRDKFIIHRLQMANVELEPIYD